VTFTVPDCAGETVVIEVGELTVKELTGMLPKSTFVAPEKFVPVIVTVVPPFIVPLAGLIPVTVGVGDK
jgi:hypothetical protein